MRVIFKTRIIPIKLGSIKKELSFDKLGKVILQPEEMAQRGHDAALNKVRGLVRKNFGIYE